ncbi:MAG: hypothetical protein A4E62_03141 [Syntrophorhabdus sp. PtaU1.Bin002]|nr:MAG: hypothetical protein A4E62_03141 [Syntrophorhabdus sp. PtaU1.Bin002]
MHGNGEIGKQTVCLGFCNRLFKDAGDPFEFTTDIDEGLTGTDGTGGNRHAFNEKVRIVLHDLSVLECSGFPFIGITDQIGRFPRVLCQKAPLHACRESCSSAPPQVGLFYLGKDRFRLHTPGFRQNLVCSTGLCNTQGRSILLTPVLQENITYTAELRAILRLRHNTLLQGVEESVCLVRGHVLIVPVIYLDGGTGPAGCQAFDLGEGEEAVIRCFPCLDAQGLLEMTEYLLRPHKGSGNIRINLKVVFPHLFFHVEHGIVGCNTVDLACRNTEKPCYVFQILPGEHVTVLFLNQLQCGHERRFFPGIFVHKAINFAYRLL